MSENMGEQPLAERRDEIQKRVSFADFINRVEIEGGEHLGKEEREERFNPLIKALKKAVNPGISFTSQQSDYFEGAINNASVVMKGTEWSSNKAIRRDLKIELALISAINSCKE